MSGLSWNLRTVFGLQRDIQLLESVQRRATRVPFGRSKPQYTVRLSLMDIPSLSARRVRGDLLVVFRALSSEQSPIRHLFTLHEGEGVAHVEIL
jgi:hypothetical protein